MKKLLLYISGGLILVLMIVLVTKNSSDKAIKVSTEKAIRRTITEIVTASGKIQPEIAVKISPDVSGEIVELHVKEGDKVEKGKLLLKIKPDLYTAAMERMEASVSTSRANLANAKARLSQVEAQFRNSETIYNRNKKLFEQGAISQSEFDATKTSFETARAEVSAGEESVHAAAYNVKSAEASLKEANDNLQKTAIYAPVSGTISKLNVELGERVVGTSQMAGTELLTLADLQEMEVSVSVHENDIVRVHTGDTTIIDIDAYQERKFKGIVTEISNSAKTDGLNVDQVTTFIVKIRILSESYQDLITPQKPYPFFTGMSATVDIQTRTVRNALSLPIGAVTSRADTTEKKSEKKKIDQEANEKKGEKEELKKKEYIFIYKDEKANMTHVTTGIQDNNYIEILSGVRENEEVITEPSTAISEKLKDGTKVKKTDKDKLFNAKESH